MKLTLPQDSSWSAEGTIDSHRWALVTADDSSYSGFEQVEPPPACQSAACGLLSGQEHKGSFQLLAAKDSWQSASKETSLLEKAHSL